MQKARNKQNKIRKSKVIINTIIIIIIILLPVGFLFGYRKIYHNKIYLGIKVGQLNLEGKTKEEALKLIKEKIAKIDRNGFAFVAQTKDKKKEVVIMPTLISPTDPDIIREILFFNPEKTVEEAFLLGRLGNVVERIREQWKIFFDRCLTLIDLCPSLSYQLDEEEFEKILKENFKELEDPAENAKLVLTKDYQPKIQLERYGYIFDYQKTIEKLKKNLNFLISEPIELNLIPDEPKVKKSQVEPAFEKVRKILDLTPIILSYENKKWQIDKKRLGNWLEFSISTTQEGNSRLNNIRIDLSKEKVYNFLKTINLEIEIKAKEAKFQMKEGKLVEFQLSQEGLELDTEKNFQEIVEKIIKDEEREINLIVKKVKPSVSTEEIDIYGIRELIGRGESNFKGSPQNRRHNIKIGAQHLHGLLIRPGEEFSLNKALGKIDAQAGYLPELVIKGNKTIPEYGGGLCQIATTTFRVALNSGLPILERQPHSYRVPYYEPAGIDATIYNPRPDFRFLNDTGNWVLLQTEISKDDLIFEFYGTNDGRKVEIAPPKIFNLVKPGPTKFIETEDLPFGKKKCTERAHTGADAEFTQTITYPDGQIKRVIWKSHYKPWRAVCLIGTKKTEKKETIQTIP